MRGLRIPAAVVAAAGLLALPAAAAQARSLYVPSYTADQVAVVNTASNSVTSTIPISGGPWQLAFTPNGKTAYVNTWDDGTLVPVDVSSGKAGTPITVNGSSSPYEVAITPDGSKAFVANEGSGTITPVDLTTGASGPPIQLTNNSNSIYSVAITPNGKTVYAADLEDSKVFPVNISTGTAGTAINVNGAYFSAVTPNGKTLWVIDANDGTLVPIDTATNTAGTPISIPGGSDLEGIAISPDGTMAYVTDGTPNEVFPVNLSTRSVGLPIPTGTGTYPYYIVMTPDGKTVYADLYYSGTVLPISTATNKAGSGVAVGGEPGQMEAVPNQGPKAAFSHRVHRRKVSLNGSGSSDSDGSVASYAWKFGDGAKKTTTSAKVTHTYKHPGHYRVTLTVTDNEGCSTQLVFTGQSAYCNGTKAARITHTVVIAKAKHHKRPARKHKTAPGFTG